MTKHVLVEGAASAAGLPRNNADLSASAPDNLNNVEQSGPSMFELFRLGESIAGIQADMRNLRLEKDELRFERDRYRASAASYQSKLTQALDMLDQNRAAVEDAARLRGEIANLADLFEQRVTEERERYAAALAEANDRVRREIAVAAGEFEAQRRKERHRSDEEVGALERASRDREIDQQAAFDAATRAAEARTRHEIAALAREFDERLVALGPRSGTGLEEAPSAPLPEPRRRWLRR